MAEDTKNACSLCGSEPKYLLVLSQLKYGSIDPEEGEGEAWARLCETHFQMLGYGTRKALFKALIQGQGWGEVEGLRDPDGWTYKEKTIMT